jgi:hypothetical protein
MAKITSCENPQLYDLIIVGSGNGACAFLRQYFTLSCAGKVLVLEEGDNFFETSDITHQRNWTKSYSEGQIFQMHTAQTPDKIPILSGRACTMGGGGSINYTMIFESSDWLSQNFGHDRAYWDQLKQELAAAFNLRNPRKNLTDVALYVQEKLEFLGFTVNEENQGYIPVYAEGKNQQIHIFPTQFDEFGQRTHSGISLLNWYDNERLDFISQRRVIKLHLETGDRGQKCAAITILNVATGELETCQLGANTRLILCAGAATPQLLYEHREKLNNREIGQSVNDHILLPFGIYLLPDDLAVTLKDQYVSLFATTEEFTSKNKAATICNYDFFSGQLNVLLYLLSHLFLAFWVPNSLKFWMIRKPLFFQFLKQVRRILVTAFNLLDTMLWSLSHPTKMGTHKWHLISAIVKFNISLEGYYEPAIDQDNFTDNKQHLYNIILRCFNERSLEKDPDFQIAAAAISQQIPLMDSLGSKPHPIFQFLIRLLTRMPYNIDQVQDYIKHYSRNDLLTEQHLSGGCVLGKAIDLGLESPQDTGKVFGSQNIYVADLSAAPLPRVSPQMTAYLIGYHVATQLFNEGRRQEAEGRSPFL